MEFTATFKITLEQISDTLCSALEGGSNYWYFIEEAISPCRWFYSSHDNPNKHYYQDYALNPGGALIISDEEEGEKYRLDLQAIQRGLQALAEKYPHRLAEMKFDEGDAETGDVFLQCCLFGDVTYS